MEETPGLSENDSLPMEGMPSTLELNETNDEEKLKINEDLKKETDQEIHHNVQDLNRGENDKENEKTPIKINGTPKEQRGTFWSLRNLSKKFQNQNNTKFIDQPNAIGNDEEKRKSSCETDHMQRVDKNVNPKSQSTSPLTEEKKNTEIASIALDSELINDFLSLQIDLLKGSTDLEEHITSLDNLLETDQWKSKALEISNQINAHVTSQVKIIQRILQQNLFSESKNREIEFFIDQLKGVTQELCSIVKQCCETEEQKTDKEEYFYAQAKQLQKRIKEIQNSLLEYIDKSFLQLQPVEPREELLIQTGKQEESPQELSSIATSPKTTTESNEQVKDDKKKRVEKWRHHARSLTTRFSSLRRKQKEPSSNMSTEVSSSGKDDYLKSKRLRWPTLTKSSSSSAPNSPLRVESGRKSLFGSIFDSSASLSNSNSNTEAGNDDAPVNIDVGNTECNSKNSGDITSNISSDSRFRSATISDSFRRRGTVVSLFPFLRAKTANENDQNISSKGNTSRKGNIATIDREDIFETETETLPRRNIAARKALSTVSTLGTSSQLNFLRNSGGDNDKEDENDLGKPYSPKTNPNHNDSNNTDSLMVPSSPERISSSQRKSLRRIFQNSEKSSSSLAKTSSPPEGNESSKLEDDWLSVINSIAGEMQLCYHCENPIMNFETQDPSLTISAFGRLWHRKCIGCKVCGVPFVDPSMKIYEGEDGWAYCENHFEEQFPLCAGCSKRVQISLGFSEAMEKKWHINCFCCTTCHEPLASGIFYELDNNPYCEIHYYAGIGRLCQECQKPIFFGRCIKAKGLRYHLQHFLCSFCKKDLTGQSFYCKERKIFCKKCNLALF